jgi:hypothetical protein
MEKKSTAVVLILGLLSGCVDSNQKIDGSRDGDFRPISKICSNSAADEGQRHVIISKNLKETLRNEYYITSDDPYFDDLPVGGFDGKLSNFPVERTNRTIRLYGLDSGCYLNISAAWVDVVSFIHQEPIDYLANLRASATPEDLLLTVRYWTAENTLFSETAVLRGRQAYISDQKN